MSCDDGTTCNFNAVTISPYGDACKGCTVHQGFYDAWVLLREPTLKGLKALGCDESTPLRLSGHSLGAAVAVLAAFELAGPPTVFSGDHDAGAVSSGVDHDTTSSAGTSSSVDAGDRFPNMSLREDRVDQYQPMVPPVRDVYTLGEPRIGNDLFVAEFGRRLGGKKIPYFRLTQYMDPVPHLPPLHVDLPADYRHAGPEIFYHSSYAVTK